MSKFCNFKNILLLSGLSYAACLISREISRPAKQRELKDKVVLITGASSGIGKALAFDFAKFGSKLVLAARSKDKLDEIAETLMSKYNSEVLTIKTDVSNESETNLMVEKALEHFGAIDILVNNAGIATYEPLLKDEPANMKKVMDVNYWGTVYSTRAVLPSMIMRGSGHIINVSSVAGLRAVPNIANYSATKHAVNGFTEALRLELAQYGIKVLLVCPTSTKTEIVKNSASKTAFRLDPENYFGMTAERVSIETINAMLDNKRDHILGLAEKPVKIVNALMPGLLDFGFKYGTRYVFRGD